jgi:TonB family protein
MMNDLLNILIQSSLSLAVMFMLYYVFLRKDTFFKTNRFYLMISLLASTLIPFIDFSTFLPAREQVLLVILDPIIITPEGIQQSVEANTNLYIIGLSIYLTGVFIFTLRFMYQLFQLYQLVKKFGVSRKQGLRIVFTNKTYSPFSFFNLVFLNQNDIDTPEYQKIIAHERVHIRQWHSLDLLVLEIITIFLWFNPFIWFYRHAVKTLHEYLADEGVLHSGVDARIYSALLFEQSTGIQVNDLTNNFSKSLLKRRFIMMTKKRTNEMARAKLIFALPLALSMLVLISFSPDMIAQEKAKDPSPAPQEDVSAEKAVVKTKEPKVIKMVEHQDEEPVYTVVEVMPKFKGGNKALYTYLGNNIKYPDVAKKEGIEGTVYVTYVVEKDGSVSHVKILRGVHESLDKEAIRVVKEMPEWEPGKQKGKPVRVQYSLPIKYTLAKDKEKEK